MSFFEYSSLHCNPSTAAYIAIQADLGVLSDESPSISLQRYNTTDQLQLLLLNAVSGEAYRAGINSALLLILAAGCVAILLLIPAAFPRIIQKLCPRASDYIQAKSYLLLVIVSMCFYACALVWMAAISTNHHSAVNDFSTQVVNCINSAVGTKLSIDNNGKPS